MLAALLTLATAATGAEQLLAGVVDGETPFALSGESREEVIGGQIQFGDRTYTITHRSRLGLLGATRDVGESQTAPMQHGEYAMFSSSFSPQTVVGDPWPAALEYRRCDVAYNSFLAIYAVDGEGKLKTLGDVPYGALSQDVSQSDQSVVYCFMSQPPAAK